MDDSLVVNHPDSIAFTVCIEAGPILPAMNMPTPILTGERVPAPPLGKRCPFARVEVIRDLDAAREAWRSLEEGAGGYQTFAFARAWLAAMGAPETLRVLVARDVAGAPVALLPLTVRRLGPVRVASFLGGSWSNYRMGLFRDGAGWTAEDVRALLTAGAGPAGIDLFGLTQQPRRWETLANPLALLPGRPSVDLAFATRLPGDVAEWLDAHFSRETQKKLRKKARKLDRLGAVAHRRASTPEEAARYIDAFFAHKAAQSQARGEADMHDTPEVRALLQRLAEGDAPRLELHALCAGDRVAAVFAAIPGGRRLSGLVISYDPSPEIATATPGEQLLIEVVRDAIARGFETLDLGVGAGRYKGEICELEEQPFDLAFGATALGRAVAPLFYASLAAKAELKRRPELMRRIRRIRKAIGR